MWLWSVMGRRVVRINSSWNCVLSGKSWYPMRNVHGYEFTHAAASCGAMREPNLLRADPALCGSRLSLCDGWCGAGALHRSAGTNHGSPSIVTTRTD